MAIGPWLIGGAALGLGVIALRSRSAAGAPSPCDALAAAGVPKSVCEGAAALLDGALDALSTDWTERETNNVARNGPATKKLSPAMPRVVAHVPTTGPNLNTALSVPAVYGTILEHANGCQPFEGAPGWGKCAPGTQSQLPKGTLEKLTPLSGPSYGYGDGNGGAKGGDPLSFADAAGRAHAMNPVASGASVQPFPLALGADQLGRWDRAAPTVVTRGSSESIGGVLGGAAGHIAHPNTSTTAGSAVVKGGRNTEMR